MIRKLLVTTVSAIGLAASAPAFAQDEAETASMDFGTWGVGLEEIDTSVEPGDDFFDYVNGKWVARTPIPDDRSSFGTFSWLAENAAEDIRVMMAELVASDPAPGKTERRIVDAYESYLDTDAIEAAGLAPAMPYLQQIYTAPDIEALSKLFAEPGFSRMISASVGVDAEDPTRYLVNLGFSGMGLPDRDYYLVDSEQNLKIREEYLKFLETMLAEAGYQDPATAAGAVYAFEKKVAVLEWDRRYLRNPGLTTNKMNRAQVLALAPEFPLDDMLDAAGFAGQDEFDIGQLPPSDEEIEALGLTDQDLALIGGGFPAMMKLLVDAPLATVKAYMAVRFLAAHAPVLPERIDDAVFAFQGGVLNGQTEKSPRWKRAISAVEGQLGEQVSALYVERHFPPEAKAEMEELVGNLQLAFKESITGNDWMTPATTERALAKLAGFTAMVGYPDEFESYDGLEIRPGDALGNRIRAIEWGRADNLAKLGQPVDNTEWAMLPQEVNAYYHPLFNQIVFPAAILQQPFFGLSADDAVNYGAIGAGIGHEIGHGFDDSGSRFDADGALRNWWQDADRAAFEAKANELKALIEQHCPVDDGALCLRGDLSIGETIGDVVGLQIAYKAYRLSLNGEEAPVIDGLTGDQRFFLGYAQIWRDMYRPESLRNRVMTANHPPSDFRLNNTVRQMDAWYEAFNVGPDDALYLAPEDRVSIW